jgi:hypothetical protein
MKTITVAGINIDIHDGPIAISASGGADSSVLLYLLLKYATDTVHVLSCADDQLPNRVAPKICTDVIQTCIALTGNRNVKQHTFFIEQKTYETWLSPVRKLTNEVGANILYTGITLFPDDEVLETFSQYGDDYPRLKEAQSYRDPKKAHQFYFNNNKFYTPLSNANKKKISEMYEELDILDTLYPVTRSCESSTLTEGHCGKCWWCDERMWAFGRLE